MENNEKMYRYRTYVSFPYAYPVHRYYGGWELGNKAKIEEIRNLMINKHKMHVYRITTERGKEIVFSGMGLELAVIVLEVLEVETEGQTNE